ncbi:glycoside hydrolase family protein [Lutibacter citreus]|uniref:glycoside hydrolase family protein n=1 Tax=Lutibacter citreus TaxID=2138210 RepID=UPI001300B002|nr:glycoside hydrolase family protein [Lutibacter citreus]
MKLKIIILILSIVSLISCKKDKNEQLNIGAMVKPALVSNTMIDPDYNIWGASVVKGDDNKYHMFYARWPKKLGHMAWVTHSEIAYAVADKPEGPYNFVNVALAKRDKNYWDGTTTHNPTVFIKDGKYYLYYMGTTSNTEAVQPTSMKNKDWWIYRNNQRIGVAVADNPNGPWQRLDKPVLDVSKDPKAYDALMTSNPAVSFTDDGKIIMLYKAVDKGESYKPIDLNSNDSFKISKGKKVRFMVAFADNPLGPFTKTNKVIFENEGSENVHMMAEDPYVWFKNKTYWSIVRDAHGEYTGDKGALALMQSANGIDWKASENSMVLGSRFLFEDGTKSEIQLERPQLLFENGKPVFLFGALGITENGIHRAHACNIRIPLEQ